MNIHVLSVVISHNDFGISGGNIYLYLYQSIAKGSLFHLYLCQHVFFTREQMGLHYIPILQSPLHAFENYFNKFVPTVYLVIFSNIPILYIS